jgi:hypothetical protein
MSKLACAWHAERAAPFNTCTTADSEGELLTVLLDINLFTSQLPAENDTYVTADVLLSQVGQAPRSQVAADASSTCSCRAACL